MITFAATVTAPKFATREEWLTAAVEYLYIHVFEPAEIYLPVVRISVGWPGVGGRKDNIAGTCHNRNSDADRINQIFISPMMSDVDQILATLGHELIHAVDDGKSGHRGDFAKMMRRVGFHGKMTTSDPTDRLAAVLSGIAVALGAYPHSKLALPNDDNGRGMDAPKRQGTRMLKSSCIAESGYTVRLTRMWIDAYGCPICPCHGLPMMEVTG